MGAGKELRPYQINCHEAVISEYEAGIIRQLIVLFTGAGKTFILIRLLERMGFKRVLWLSFQEELVVQTAMAFIKDKFEESFYNKVEEMGFLEYLKKDNSFPDNFKLGCIKADLFISDANVVMGSVMTVTKRLNALPPDYFDCIICDEAHLFASISAVNVLNHFSPKLLIGATATPTRADGLPLSDIFQKITFEYNLLEGIKDGYACEMDAVKVKTNVSLDKVKTTAGEFNLKDLTNEVNTLARNQLIVDSYKKYCLERPCIAFCVDIQHAMDLAEQFRLNGFNCMAVSSNEELTPGRSENIKKYKDLKLNIITNVNILVAGFDMVDTGCIIMAAPTKSITKYLQAVGRGSRLKNKWYVDKFTQSCTIIDIVDNTSRHNLVNAWELDREKDVEDRVFVSREKKDKLLAERKKKAFITHERKEDEIVKLLALPRLKVNKSFRMSEEATPLQLATIKKWGYDIETKHFTKSMISEIFNKQELGYSGRQELISWGYDITGRFVSIGEYQLAKKEHEEKSKKKSKTYR